MHHSGFKFIRGAAAGIALGAVAATVGNAMVKNKKGFKKSASKAIRAVGDIMENVQYMMR